MEPLTADHARLIRTEPERGSGAGRTLPGGRLTTCLIPHLRCGFLDRLDAAPEPITGYVYSEDDRDTGNTSSAGQPAVHGPRASGYMFDGLATKPAGP